MMLGALLVAIGLGVTAVGRILGAAQERIGGGASINVVWFGPVIAGILLFALGFFLRLKG